MLGRGFKLSISSSKSKNPARCSVVLALGESSSKAICQGRLKNPNRLLHDKTTQYPAGLHLSLTYALMPLKTVGNVTHFSACQQIFFKGVGGSHKAVLLSH